MVDSPKVQELARELRSKHAEFMILFNEAAADAGGVEHWRQTHRTDWLRGNLTTGKTFQLVDLGRDILVLREQIIEARRQERAEKPPSLETLEEDSELIGTYEGWTGEELANAGHRLGLEIYAKGFIDCLVMIAGFFI